MEERMVRRQLALLVLPLVLFFSGCAARPIHPGAANSFDSNAYDALLVTDSVIQSTKADLTNNVFSATVSASVKTALNNLITAYDVADVAYVAYHSAALSAAGATAAQQTAVTTSLNSVSTSTTALVTAKAGK